MIAQALEIDPDLAEAHATKGLMLMHDLNLRQAEDEFRRAIELKPSYASAHQWYSQLLLAESEWDESLKHSERAVELDPLSLIIRLNHAAFYDNRREYAKSLELYKKALELDPNFGPAHFEIAAVYWKLKKPNDARREAEAGLKLLHDAFPQAARAVEAMTAYFENDTARLRKLLPELEAHIGEPVSPSATEIGGLYLFVGEIQKGFECLERAFARREFNLLYLSSGELFDNVRGDERYLNIIKRLGLKPATIVQ
jgi:tetratricopeptide (TPR) repeat protein